ncbi:MAG: LCP family protein [Micrococcales bacterium]
MAKAQGKLGPIRPRHSVLEPTSQGKNARRFWLRIVGVFASSALVIAGFSAYSIANQLQGNGFQILDSNGNAVSTPANLKGPINMLLVGSDTRAGQGGGFGTETSNLADVIILLHVSADRKNAVALSFPRDLLVPWPACPSTTGGPGYLPQALGQINATIANGGPGCTLLTVETLTGLKIPYLAMINFKGVIEMSNAIGGVEVCVANPIIDEYTHTNLSAGRHVLQGKAALQFLRTRHGVGDGSDLSRISNQQVFLKSLVRKVKSQGVLTNPIYLYNLASAAARNMTLSSNLTDLNTLVGLASALKDVSLDKMTFLQVPAHGGLPAPYSGRVAPDEAASAALFALIREDKPVLIENKSTDGTTPSPSPSASASTGSSASPSPSASALDNNVYRGSNAEDDSCSN